MNSEPQSQHTRYQERSGLRNDFGNKGHEAFKAEQDSMPQSGMFGYYFPYSQADDTYDLSSYNSAFSDGRIQYQQLQPIVEEIKKSLRSSNGCNKLLLASPIIWVVYIIVIIVSKWLIWVILVALLIATVLQIGLCYYASVLNRRNKMDHMKVSITKILQKHQNSTFKDQHVLIRLSKEASYIAFEFGWKTNPAGGFGAVPMNQSMAIGMTNPALNRIPEQNQTSVLLAPPPQSYAYPIIQPPPEAPVSEEVPIDTLQMDRAPPSDEKLFAKPPPGFPRT